MLRPFPLILLIECLLLAGCEDSLIDPFASGKHFTVYGYLNAFDIDHSVRVIAVRRSPENITSSAVPHAEIDAVVTSMDLTTNAPVRWTHSLQQLDDGTYGHIFNARFVVREGHRYRLVIRRSDGAESTAETTVPYLGPPVGEPARITADSVTQALVWPDAGVPDKIVVVYCAKPVGSFSCDPIEIDYGRAGRRTPNGWKVTVNLKRDLDFVRQQLGVDSLLPLELSTVEMEFTSLDEDWKAPVGEFDPDVFGQPGALTNVENGFGFWGSVARGVSTWTPDTAALDALGYVPPE